LLTSRNIPIPENFPISTIAQISEGYTYGGFKMCMNKVLTERRMLRIKDEPIKLSEFVGPLSSSYTTSPGEFLRFKVHQIFIFQF